MATDVIMPALGVAQETGKVLKWLRAEGEEVEQGAPLMEIETDKVTVEVEAPASGTLAGIRFAEGTDVPVGDVVALIVAAGEEPPATAPAAVDAAEPAMPALAATDGNGSPPTASRRAAAARLPQGPADREGTGRRPRGDRGLRARAALSSPPTSRRAVAHGAETAPPRVAAGRRRSGRGWPSGRRTRGRPRRTSSSPRDVDAGRLEAWRETRAQARWLRAR